MSDDGPYQDEPMTVADLIAALQEVDPILMVCTGSFEGGDEPLHGFTIKTYGGMGEEHKGKPIVQLGGYPY